jgi:hypothetical protein
MSLIRRTACARAHFSGCSPKINAHSETGQMAVCCQNLTLGALSSRSALSMLVGALFKKFGLFLNTPCIQGSPKLLLRHVWRRVPALTNNELFTITIRRLSFYKHR